MKTTFKPNPNSVPQYSDGTSFVPLYQQNYNSINKVEKINLFKSLSKTQRQLAIDMEIVKNTMDKINGNGTIYMTNMGPVTTSNTVNLLSLEELMRAHFEQCIEEEIQE